MTRLSRWPIVLSLVTFALLVASTAILVATSSVDVPVSWGFRGSSTLFALTAGSVGAVVCIRRPDNRVVSTCRSSSRAATSCQRDGGPWPGSGFRNGRLSARSARSSPGGSIRRFRAADDVARRQIKWFALAATVAGVTDTLYYVSYVASPNPAVTKALELLVVASLLGLPVAAGLAILRYRLYDIDRIVSRTISYGLISAILLGGYTTAILLLQQPLSGIFGSDTILVAISTLVVATLFQPLRRRVQAIVDRRFDRARFDAERTAAAFAQRLRDEVDIEAVSDDRDRTVRPAVRPASVGLWLREVG